MSSSISSMNISCSMVGSYMRWGVMMSVREYVNDEMIVPRSTGSPRVRRSPDTTSTPT